MNIHLFSFVRDEAYLLRRWIPYHASIIGIENIHIINHKSEDPECLAILNHFGNKGMDLRVTSKHFDLKYKLLTQLMHRRKAGADILIPLDADEFLCLCEQDGSMVADPPVVRKYLQSLSVNGKKYAFHVFEAVLDRIDYDDPLTEIKTFRHYQASETASGPNQQTKTFFPAKNFSYTDQGNHKGGVLLAPNDVYNISKMAIAHFHMRGFSHFLKKLEKAVDAFQLQTFTPDYEGTGMSWNRWYQQTKNLDLQQKREWFRENFVQPDAGTEQTAVSKALQVF